ncbi:MAG TPA: HAD family phosphatase, partial [Ilumatobacteraceae bacterium]|nr:HAD family phosphatase [Ilumatobacteraceae bacterium]
RHSDFAKRFPPEHAERVIKLFVGDYAEDGDHPWHRLERGEITFEENRRLNRIALAEAGIELPAPPPGGAPMIVFTPSEPMVELVKELRAAEIRMGVLTNNVLEFREHWRSMMPFDEWFDDIVDSHEVGLRKPNPAIFQLALARLGAEAGRTVFLDDVATNVSAAESVGIRGVLVDEDPTDAIAVVRRLVGFSD